MVIVEVDFDRSTRYYEASPKCIKQADVLQTTLLAAVHNYLSKEVSQDATELPALKIIVEEPMVDYLKAPGALRVLDKYLDVHIIPTRDNRAVGKACISF